MPFNPCVGVAEEMPDTQGETAPQQHDIAVDSATGTIGQVASHALFNITLLDVLGNAIQVPVTRLRKALPGERRRFLAALAADHH